MKRQQEHALRKAVGDLGALYGIKAYTLNGGAQEGVKALDLDNGNGLEMTVLESRALDIALMRFKGVNLGFYSKTGIRHPAYYQEDGARGFLRQFYAGLLTTCGITYAGAACEDEGQALGLHGPLSNTPAEMVSYAIDYDGDDAVLRVKGQMREARVFDENMLLGREIALQTERNVMTLTDTVTNLGFTDSPCMLVYHVNFGYPLLDDGAVAYFSAKNAAPRDEIARRGFDKYALMEQPGIERPEECFFHTGEPDPDEGFAMLHNPKLGIAAILKYDPKVFPLLCQWKCMRAGDYALGLEPTTAGVMGRAAARADGLPVLGGGESRVFRLSLTLTDDRDTIDGYIARAGK